MKVEMNNRQSDVQIEILPMIDVIFCILTFFILAAVGLTRQQVIDLTLPSVNNSVPVSGDSRDRLYVSVDSVGQVYIDANAVPLSLLKDVLLQHQQIAPNGTIVLEIGYQQGDAVAALAAENSYETTLKHDLAGRPRRWSR